MDTRTIYHSAQRSTASGRGPSYWETPMVCGKKLALAERNKGRYDLAHQSDATKVGTYYHFLMESWQKGTIPEGVILDTSEVSDAAWSEAVRLFGFYTGIRTKDHWGRVVGAEVKLPVTPKHRESIEVWFGIYGEDCPTGQIDLLVELSSGDVARLENEHGYDLRGPGFYIVDYKTTRSRVNELDALANYTRTVQSMMYPVLWNLAGGEPVKGVIYDVVIKHRNLSSDSLQSFFAPTCPSHKGIVRSAIRIARASKMRGRPNAYACYYKGYECYFLRTSQCSRM